MNTPVLRIGHGFDVHPFLADRKLILGGLEIPFELGLQGHSDADVLLHAICDALLGAAGLGDIGQHFPDSDSSYAGISSQILLQNVVNMLQEKNWQVSNIDTTVIAQLPRLENHIPDMQQQIAKCIRCAPEIINIKATTTERLGCIGRGEGIAVEAVALICKRP